VMVGVTERVGLAVGLGSAVGLTVGVADGCAPMQAENVNNTANNAPASTTRGREG
jgi:hypothetical protein